MREKERGREREGEERGREGGRDGEREGGRERKGGREGGERDTQRGGLQAENEQGQVNFSTTHVCARVCINMHNIHIILHICM